MYARLLASVMFATLSLAFSSAPASAQPCEGDCNGDRTVPINELILAVRIALGNAAVGECTAVDRDGNGQVSVNEVVAAVARALGGCDGEIDESKLVASARIAVEPIIRIIDLGSAATGGGGGVGSIGRAGAGRPAGSSGCQQFDCFVFDEFTGTEEVCCFGTEYTLNSFNCSFIDGASNLVTRDGSFTLRSDDPSVCSGNVPPGVSFEAISEEFHFEIEDLDGNFLSFDADLSETFVAAPAGCTDEFGFGIFGDGTRTLLGDRFDFLQDGSGNVLVDQATTFDPLELAVLSVPSEEGCAVGVSLNGTLASADFAAGTFFSADYTNFAIAQVPSGGALFLAVNGTVGTDCVGDVTLTTIEPLRLVPGDACLSGGNVQADLDDGSVAVSYTPNGGLELDFGPDGSVDQSFNFCLDVVSDVCVGS
jgi:hypothetical protein